MLLYISKTKNTDKMRLIPPNSRFIFLNKPPDTPGGYQNEGPKESPKKPREKKAKEIRSAAKKARRGISLLAARELDSETVEAFRPLDKEKISAMKPGDFVNHWIRNNPSNSYLDLEQFVQDNDLPQTFVPEYRAFLEQRRLLLGDAGLKPTRSKEINNVRETLVYLLGDKFNIQVEDEQITFSLAGSAQQSQALLTRVKVPFTIYFREKRESRYRHDRTKPFDQDQGIDLIGPDGTTFPLDYTLMKGQDTEGLTEEQRNGWGGGNREFTDYVNNQFLLTLGPEMERALNTVLLDLNRGGYKIYITLFHLRRSEDTTSGVDEEKPLVYEINASKGKTGSPSDSADDKREIHLIMDRNGHIEVKEIEVED